MQRFDAEVFGQGRVELLSLSQRAAWYLRTQRHDVLPITMILNNAVITT